MTSLFFLFITIDNNVPDDNVKILVNHNLEPNSKDVFFERLPDELAVISSISEKLYSDISVLNRPSNRSTVKRRLLQFTV